MCATNEQLSKLIVDGSLLEWDFTHQQGRKARMSHIVMYEVGDTSVKLDLA